MRQTKKEIWFRPYCRMPLETHQLNISYRDLAESWKNNNYTPNDVVTGRIVHYPENGNRYFEKKEYRIRILGTRKVKIGALKPFDFKHSDARSKPDLKRKLTGYYKKTYRDANEIRVIKFKVLGFKM